MKRIKNLGRFELDQVYEGDSLDLIYELPDESLDIIITSPPYWGQRTSSGMGVEDDPREYLTRLELIFTSLLPKMKKEGLLWINIGDAYNTPINWKESDKEYSTLGADKKGLKDDNSAYTKPRAARKAFKDKNVGWLKYGNLLALTYRMVINLSEKFYFRGEVIWRKLNPMPEGKCRRPHRQHESIYLFSKNDKHEFRTSPPVGSVWDFGNEKIKGGAHFSRFPLELPKRCIEAYGKKGKNIIVFDPFSGSGTTGIAAKKLGCSYLGFEIDPFHVEESNQRLKEVT